jgi:hypothetical protein
MREIRKLTAMTQRSTASFPPKRSTKARPAAHPVPAHQSLLVLATLPAMLLARANVAERTNTHEQYTQHAGRFRTTGV